MRKLTRPAATLLSILACGSAFATEQSLAAASGISPSQPLSAAPNVDHSMDEARVDMLVDNIRQDVINKKTDRAPLLVIAAKQGNGKACNLLGWMFDNGIGVPTKEPVKALQWFESCANKNSLASYNAGVMYIEGRGVDKDTKKGMAYLKKSWVVGGTHFHPQMPQIPIRLAYFYRKQQLPGSTDAWDWADRAADVDAKHGKYLVARMLMEKSAPMSDDVKALSFLNAAVDASSAPAASLLAWGYGTGRFGDKDYVLAQEYEDISAKIDPRLVPVASTKWSGYVKESGKKKAEALANNWVSIHKPPKPLDYVSTLNGTEDQFKR